MSISTVCKKSIMEIASSFKENIYIRIFIICYIIIQVGITSYSTYCMTYNKQDNNCVITCGASCLLLMILCSFIIFSFLFNYFK